MIPIRWSTVYHPEVLHGRISTMTLQKQKSGRVDLLQGTLDMLIMRTLSSGPAHGHSIAKHIQSTTDDVLRVEHGSLYPALHRLERKGWIASKWQTVKDGKREFKFYRLTAAGHRQLGREESKWQQLVSAIGCVRAPSAEEV
jgi:PadR family transcriptional regulator, regulatory protein PadR